MLPIYIALVCENDAVREAVGEAELARVAAALDKQVTRDLGPIWGVEATVNPAFSLGDVPVGSWRVRLVEDGGRLGPELGYHRDEFGQPYALVALTDNWSLIASHEILEMAVDPFGDRMVPGPSIREDDRRVSYLVEVCDPVQSPEFSYTVNNVMVSDFVTPLYYGPVKTASERYSFTGAATGPREVMEGGYISWRNQVTENMEQLHRRASIELFITLVRPEGCMGSVREFVDAPTRNLELEQGVSDNDERLQSEIQAEEGDRQARQQTAEAPREQMPSEQDKILVEGFWGSFNKIQALDSILGDNFRLHAPGYEVDRANVEALFRIIRIEMHNLHFEREEPSFEEPLGAEGSRLVSRWKGSGHFSDQASPPSPSGEEIEVSGVSFFRTSQGKIADTWINPEVALHEPSPGTGGAGRWVRKIFGILG